MCVYTNTLKFKNKFKSSFKRDDYKPILEMCYICKDL